MASLLSHIRDGNWITRDRLVAYAFILIAVYVIGIGWGLVTAKGLVDSSGRPLGTDFSNVWSAGQLLLQGQPELAYDPAAHHAEQQRIFDDPQTPFYGWHYPPIFFLIAGLLAMVPYLPALVLWQASTLGLYLLVIRRVAQQPVAPLLAIAFPAVFVNLTHGHNGFLTATLLGGGLLALPIRPVLAGLLFGLLAYKPHFGVLLPFALLAGGYWRAFTAAATTVVAVIAGTVFLYGLETWMAFFDSLSFTRTVVLEAGTTGWHKIQSAFSAVRMLGGPVGLAYGVQAALTLSCIVAIVWLWRSSVDFSLKAAGLITGSLLVTPYLLDYDTVILAPAIALLAVHGVKTGFMPWEKSVLLFAGVAPLVSRPLAMAVPVSVGFIAMACLMLVIVLHAAEAARRSADTARHEFA